MPEQPRKIIYDDKPLFEGRLGLSGPKDIKELDVQRVKPPKGFFKSGDLYVKETDSNGGIVVVDASQMPSPTDKQESAPVQSESTYFDLPPETVKRVLKKHESKKILLATGLSEQETNYFKEILASSGVEQDRPLSKNLSDCLTYVVSDTVIDDEIKTQADEWFKTLPFEHPVSSLTSKKVGRGAEVTSKDYGDQDKYDKLVTLLMPPLWDSYTARQKTKLLSAFLFLFRSTANYENIDAPQVCLRLAEIADSSSNSSIRESAYAVMSAIDYQQLPQRSIETAVTAMIKNNEYANELALLVMADQKHGQQLREAHEKFYSEVYAELVQDKETLNNYTAPQWSRLAQKTVQLGLIEVDDSRKIGIELEMAPLGSDTARGLDVANTAIVKNSNFPIADCNIDLDCVEVKSISGGFVPDAPAMVRLRDFLRDYLGHQPSVLASIHVHIGKGVVGSEKVQEMFYENKTSTRHGTHEIRSFTPPKKAGQMTMIDVAYLQNQAVFCSTLDQVPISGETAVKTQGYDPDLAIRKVVALNLFGNADPRQRAAVLSTVSRGKCFLDAVMLSKLFAVSGASVKLEALIGYLAQENVRDFLQLMIRAVGIESISSQFLAIRDAAVRDQIILAVSSLGSIPRAELDFVFANYSSIKDPVVRSWVIAGIAKYAREEGNFDSFKMLYKNEPIGSTRITMLHNMVCFNNPFREKFAMDEFAAEKDPQVKDSIISIVATNCDSQESKAFVFDHFASVKDDTARDRIILAAAEHGQNKEWASFMRDHFASVKNYYTRKIILLIVSKWPDNENIDFLMDNFNILEDDDDRATVFSHVASNLAKQGVEGFEVLQKMYDSDKTESIKFTYLYSVLLAYGVRGVDFVLANYATCAETDMRLKLVEYMSNYTKVSAEVLQKLYYMESDPKVLTEIFAGIIRESDVPPELEPERWVKAAIPDVSSYLALGDIINRYEVIHQVSMHQDQASLDFFKEIYAVENSPHLRQEILRAARLVVSSVSTSYRPEGQAMNWGCAFFKQIYEMETDQELRGLALFYAVKYGDEEGWKLAVDDFAAMQGNAYRDDIIILVAAHADNKAACDFVADNFLSVSNNKQPDVLRKLFSSNFLPDLAGLQKIYTAISEKSDRTTASKQFRILSRVAEYGMAGVDFVATNYPSILDPGRRETIVHDISRMQPQVALPFLERLYPVEQDGYNRQRIQDFIILFQQKTHSA